MFHSVCLNRIPLAEGVWAEPGRWRRPGHDQARGSDGVLAVEEVRRARIWIPMGLLCPASYL